MSHLAEVYAKDLGVKIGNPICKPHFFPVVDENYITIHTDDNVQSKHYEYWEEVLTLVKKAAPDIKFIQIGSGKEPSIKNADKFIKTTSIKQSAYIIKNALMHVGIDSSPVHIASHLNKPIVCVYAHTYASTCDPLWGEKDDHIIIESDRDGEKPSFSLKEQDKNINKINPEEIANAILVKLGFEAINLKTLFLGRLYKQKSLDVIPDHPYDITSHNISIRLDLLHNEENIIPLLQKNHVSIRTSKPIDQKILKHKNIKYVQYIADSFDDEFVNNAIKFGKTLNLYCTSKENLDKERAKFFDLSIGFYSRSEKIKSQKKKLTLDKFSYSSNRKVLKNKKIHPSMYSVNNSENLDDFYLDLDHMFVYTMNHE